MYYIFSTDGENAQGGLRKNLPDELKDADKPTRIAAGWFDYVSTDPEHTDREAVICVGFKRFGDDFTGIYEIREILMQENRYSTLSIKRELASLGKWDAAKSLMQSSSVWDDFILANYLAETDPVFSAAKTAFVQAGILTQAELDEMLPKCIWSAD